jgi:hypothetical protein
MYALPYPHHVPAPPVARPRKPNLLPAAHSAWDAASPPAHPSSRPRRSATADPVRYPRPAACRARARRPGWTAASASASPAVPPVSPGGAQPVCGVTGSAGTCGSASGTWRNGSRPGSYSHRGQDLQALCVPRRPVGQLPAPVGGPLPDDGRPVQSAARAVLRHHPAGGRGLRAQGRARQARPRLRRPESRAGGVPRRRWDHQIYGHLVPSSFDCARSALDRAYHENRNQRRPRKRC